MAETQKISVKESLNDTGIRVTQEDVEEAKREDKFSLAAKSLDFSITHQKISIFRSRVKGENLGLRMTKPYPSTD